MNRALRLILPPIALPRRNRPPADPCVRRRRGWFALGLMCFPLAALSAGPLAIAEAPLAPRSGPRSATMFVTLAPEQTGVVTENNYPDPKMWGELYQEFALGAIGTGIAIGDYDADGRPDLFIVSKVERSRLFRNLGGWKFEDVTDRAGLDAVASAWSQGLAWMKRSVGQDSGESTEAEAWKQGATFADINNDGRLDLYICRFGVPNLLYVNQGDGTFKEEAAARGLAIEDASGMAAFCDYDRDGWLDVFIQTNMLNAAVHPGGQRDYLLRNKGDGTFSDVSARAGIAGETLAHSATWWDYDSDGWPDLYLANDFAGPDRLYHNNRNGTFTDTLNEVLPHTPYSSMGADLGDVNNDGRIDFLVADMAATTHEKDQRAMASSRAFTRTDHDDPEIAPQLLRNALYVNTGASRFLEAAILAGVDATDWTWSVRFEDLDNDGRLDLHVTNGMNREYHSADLRDRMIAAENPAAQMRVMRASPEWPEPNLAYRNLGDLRFENVSAAWGLDHSSISFGAAFGDLDGDGDLDLVHSNYRQGASVLRNDSDSGHRVTIALRGTRSNRFGVGTTVRLESRGGIQVRQLALARGYLSNSEPILHFGLGNDERIDRLTISWPGGHEQTFADLAVDRRFTITEPSSPPPSVREPASSVVTGQFTEVSRAMNFALPLREDLAQATSRQPLLPIRFERRGPALAVGDLDGDGFDDVALGGTTRDPARVLRASASGFSVENLAPSAGALTADGPILLFDANGDGSNDLLLTKASEQPLQLLLNDGRGAFQAAATGMLPPLRLSGGVLTAADWDRDGQLDVFVGARLLPGRYPLPPRSALLANRGGKFEDVTEALAPGLHDVGLVTSALWSDVDGDGWLDLVVALEWGGVRFWRNDRGQRFEDHSERAGFASAGTGWWNSLAAADFNGDGRPDFVAGNLGLNTQYRAAAERPALLFYGDFASTGAESQIVEAYYEGDRLFPWRFRKDLGAKIPVVAKKYPRSDLYARATLGEILGEDRLAAARRFAATEFRSGVFLSQVDGTYRFEPLPRMAQIAPIYGLAAGDFDGDGHADVYAVQNSSAPIACVGRFDGGLSQLLRGDGRGNFAAIPPAESNLIVAGDAKALAVIDLDRNGWPDFLITRNNGTTAAYRNNGVAGRKSLRIALRGLAGNPTAIGALLTLELADGTMCTREVHAGSGYYSESTAACFFGYADSNPPRRVHVRWPTGATSQHEALTALASLTLNEPAR